MPPVFLVVFLRVQVVTLCLDRVAERCADYGAFLSADQCAGDGADDGAARAAVLLGERTLRGEKQERQSQEDGLEFLHHDDEEMRTGCLL